MVRTTTVCFWLAALALQGCASADDGSGSEPGPCDLPGIQPENCSKAHSLLLPEALPEARGNRIAEDEAAATFGLALFFDARLGNGATCPTCHLPELAFTDRVSVSTGTGVGNRNAPTVFNVARLSVMFWDGKADSLWSQPLFAIENPVEMDSTRLELAHLIAGDTVLRTQYEGLFGAVPDVSGLPARGKPGDEAFDQLDAEAQRTVNLLAANVGKAMEAYQRKNTTGRSAFDRFLLGDASSFGVVQQRGLDLFLSQGCDGCHGGPMFTDESFHVVDFPSLEGASADPGWAEGLPVLQANPFNLAGEFADPGPGVPGAIPEGPAEYGAFRTPSLRNVARTAPYGHDGALESLREVLTVHAPELDDAQVGDLVAFFQTLNGDYPLPPWNKWPMPL